MSFSTSRTECVFVLLPFAFCLAMGCSSGTTSSIGPEGGVDGGGGDGGPGSDSGPALAIPQVTFASDVSRGTHSAAECSKSGTLLEIGSFGNPALGRVDPADPTSPLKDPVRPVRDGAMEGTGTVTVSCAVTPDGDAFLVKLSTQLSGMRGGAATISGRINPVGDSTGVSVSITQLGVTFTDANCTARFDSVAGQAVAAGRVWATVDCPNAASPATQLICKTTAELRFENCAQQ